MRIIGLTGGISLWKNTISDLFKYHGIPVVDAFLVTRDVLKKGAGGWKKVVAAFGDDILQADGEVDMPRLGQIVFTVPAKRQLLNRLRGGSVLDKQSPFQEVVYRIKIIVAVKVS